jgi:hypothetical protein
MGGEMSGILEERRETAVRGFSDRRTDRIVKGLWSGTKGVLERSKRKGGASLKRRRGRLTWSDRSGLVGAGGDDVAKSTGSLRTRISTSPGAVHTPVCFTTDRLEVRWSARTPDDAAAGAT